MNKFFWLSFVLCLAKEKRFNMGECQGIELALSALSRVCCIETTTKCYQCHKYFCDKHLGCCVRCGKEYCHVCPPHETELCEQIQTNNLLRELRELMTAMVYAPGLPKYEEAKSDFESRK